jgi:hypothetical protein
VRGNDKLRSTVKEIRNYKFGVRDEANGKAKSHLNSLAWKMEGC